MKNSCSSKDPEGWKSSTFSKRHCRAKIALGSRHLTQNSWSWCHFVGKMNVLPNNIKNNSVASTMFLKLTIKVVAFFLGHPVYLVQQVHKPHQLEMVQRRAARFVMNDYAATSSVTSMLNNLQWSSLQQRRRSSRLTLLYKALNQQSAIDIPPYVKPAIRSRGNDDSRFIPLHCRTHAYMHSYLPKTLINWNSLSIDTKNQSSAPKFQAALRTV